MRTHELYAIIFDSMSTRGAPVSESILQQAYERLTNEDNGRVCRDIPDELCEEQPRSFG